MPTSKEALAAAEALLPGMYIRDDAKILATAELIDREFAGVVRERRRFHAVVCRLAELRPFIDSERFKLAVCMVIDEADKALKETRPSVPASDSEGSV